ncbi:MAG: LysR family transcriptional regulator [Anderseniella sp.]|nr:LysR family transcriptional regulator [Anderseniella sp.]
MEKNDPNVLRSLQYFEAVARHRSVKLAAEDLGVTQSAVSHQVRRFSEAIGQQLMVKSGRGIALTPAGERLGKRLSAVFGGLEDLVKDLVGDGQQSLQLAVCSTFGPGWLAERLEDFYRCYPELDLELRLYAQNPLYANIVADAYVVADVLKAGYTAIPLKEEFLIAVEAPACRQHTKEAGKRRLITTDVERNHLGEDWADFCKATGTSLTDIQEGSFRLCSHYLLALELAKAGQGVALVPDFLAARDIRSGNLVAFHDALVPSGRTYCLCIKETRANETKLKKLADWLSSITASSAN